MWEKTERKKRKGILNFEFPKLLFAEDVLGQKTSITTAQQIDK